MFRVFGLSLSLRKRNQLRQHQALEPEEAAIKRKDENDLKLQLVSDNSLYCFDRNSNRALFRKSSRNISRKYLTELILRT